MTLKLILKGGPGSGWHAPPRGTHSGEKHRQTGSGRTSGTTSIVGAQIDSTISEIWKIAGIGKPSSGVRKRLTKSQADKVFDKLSDSKLKRSMVPLEKAPGGIGMVQPRVFVFKYPGESVTARFEARHSRFDRILNVGDDAPSSDWLVVAVDTD
jgi:hypothetical protein